MSVPSSPYKKDGRIVWFFHFYWIDDCTFNKGYDELEGSFIGTQEEFDEWCKDEQDGQGFCCWQVHKRYATKVEYEFYLYD